MFTGIVDAIGTIEEAHKTEAGISARIKAPYDVSGINLGASISCNGVCLTVTDMLGSGDEAIFNVDISPETISVTGANSWAAGNPINLERSMRIGDEIGGHIVSGHVDGLAEIIALTKEGSNSIITFRAPRDLAAFIAPKGSVCLNGTSLTVNQVDDQEFTINLIPHTIKVTNWKNAAVGNQVNLEIDMLARYVARQNAYKMGN